MVLGRFNIAVVVTSRAGAGRISSAFTSPGRECGASVARTSHAGRTRAVPWGLVGGMHAQPDRKSTRLNSSHSQISYAVFCLKKKICQGWMWEAPVTGVEARCGSLVRWLGEAVEEQLPWYHQEEHAYTWRDSVKEKPLCTLPSLWSAKLSLPSPSRRCEVLELAVDLVQIKGLWIKFATNPVHHLLMLGVLRVLYTRCSSFLALTFHQGESGSCVDRSSSR